MTEREEMPYLPTSGQILGVLVSKLGIKHSVLQSRTARRYFSADPERLVKDSTKAEIIGIIAEVLTDSGFVMSQQVREDNYETAPTLASHATVARGPLGLGEVVYASKDNESPARQSADGLGSVRKTGIY